MADDAEQRDMEGRCADQLICKLKPCSVLLDHTEVSRCMSGEMAGVCGSVEKVEEEDVRSASPPSSGVCLRKRLPRTRSLSPSSSVTPPPRKRGRNQKVVLEESNIETTRKRKKKFNIEKIVTKTCSFCSLKFPSQEILMEHFDEFHVTEFSCRLCLANFPSSLVLKLHLKNIHAPSKEEKNNDLATVKPSEFDTLYKFPCLYCKNIFKGTMALNKHVRKVHNACKTCSDCFESETLIREHENNHALGLIIFYQCRLCKVDFKTLEQLQDHKYKNHLINGSHSYSYCKVKKFLPQITVSSIPKNHIQCVYCDLLLPTHLILDHNKTVHSVIKCSNYLCDNYLCSNNAEFDCLECMDKEKVKDPSMINNSNNDVTFLCDKAQLLAPKLEQPATEDLPATVFDLISSSMAIDYN